MNVAALVGHGALRVRRMEDWTRLADPGERAAMAEDVLEAMEAGAVGLSTGLAYPTNRGADTAEVVQLAKAAASRGGVLAMHVRDEFDGVMEAVSEAFRCARESGAFLVLSHQKVAGRKYRGRSAELFDRYAKDGAGVPFAMDTYPYTAGSSVLDATWVPHCEKVLVAWSRPHPELAGKDLGAIIQAWGCSMEEAVERLQPAGAVYFHMDQADVDRILASDRCMVGSDGLPADEHPHPRLWGAFARMLADQVRERGRLTLGEAVRRMSALPAQVFGLEGRGRILPGFWGDLVIFDPARIQDQSTYTDPRRPAAGVERVLVNGRQAWPGPGAHGRYLRGGKSPADR
jgi:N-acyl-D-amino-acid deacylase